MTVLGKIVGGGMPLAAFGGDATIMDHLAPQGQVYQAGTLSGNPIATTCGIATLSVIEDTDNFYSRLSNATKSLVDGVNGLAKQYGISLATDYQGGMFGFHFSDKLAKNFEQVKLANEKQFMRFFTLMLKQNIFFAPSMYEAGFVCISHNDDIIAKTLEAVESAFQQL